MSLENWSTVHKTPNEATVIVAANELRITDTVRDHANDWIADQENLSGIARYDGQQIPGVWRRRCPSTAMSSLSTSKTPRTDTKETSMDLDTFSCNQHILNLSHQRKTVERVMVNSFTIHISNFFLGNSPLVTPPIPLKLTCPQQSCLVNDQASLLALFSEYSCRLHWLMDPS